MIWESTVVILDQVPVRISVGWREYSARQGEPEVISLRYRLAYGNAMNEIRSG